jgi:tetratricopeptide (TPR) repeat protein
MAETHLEEIAKLETLYASNPEGRVFTHLADAYRKAGELDRAREILEQGLPKHENYASAHVVLGRVLEAQGEYDAATGAFNRVLALDPENRIALRSLGDLARTRGDTEGALEVYGQLLQIDPGADDVRAAIEDIVAGAAPAAGFAADEAGIEAGETAADETREAPYDAEPEGAWHAADHAVAARADEADEASEPEVAEPSESAAGPDGDAWAGRAEPDAADFTDEAAGNEQGMRYDAVGRDSAPARPDPWANEAAPDVEDSGPGGEWEGAEAESSIRQDDVEPTGPDDPQSEYRAPHDVDDYGNVPIDSAPIDVEEPAPADEQAPRDDSPGVTDIELQSDVPWTDSSWDSGAEQEGAGDALTMGYDLTDMVPDDSVEAEPAGEDTDTDADLVDWNSEEAAADAAVSGLDGAVQDEVREPADTDPAAVREPPELMLERGLTSEPVDAFPGDLADFRRRPGLEAPRMTDAAETEVYTETLAELYRAQGLHEKAVEVYRALLADRPGDQRLLEALRDLEAVPGVGADEGMAAGDAAAREADAWAEVAGTTAAVRSDGDGDEWREDVDPWTAPATVGGAHDTPYAWAEETPAPAGESDKSIADLFNGLLGWRPVRTAAEEADAGAQPVELASSADGQEARPDSADTAPASPIGDAPDSGPAERAEPMPWEQTSATATPSSAAGPSSAAAESELMPWETPAAEAPAPESGAPTDPMSAVDAGSGASGAWTDEKSSGAAPDSGSEGEEGEDDDDLEMFRSWLQSLKK